MCTICDTAEGCLRCGDKFTDLSHLMAHVKSMHPDDYPDTWPDGEIVYFEEEVT